MNKPLTIGYFAECDRVANLRLGYLYGVFLRNWVFQRVEDWADADQFVFCFENDQLLKVDVVSDRKITKSFSREEWLMNRPNLDSRDELSIPLYSQEYIDNEPKFMKYIRFSPFVVPISGNYFVLPIPVSEGKNV